MTLRDALRLTIMILCIPAIACGSLNLVQVGPDVTVHYKDFFTEEDLTAEIEKAGFDPAVYRADLTCSTVHNEPTRLLACEQPLEGDEIVRYWWDLGQQAMQHATILCETKNPCQGQEITGTE